MSLADALPELRKPFTAAAIKAKPQATTGEGDAMKGLVSFYIDARLAAARLTHVVKDGWQDEYDVLIRDQQAVAVGIPVECRLTVLGITRCDIGQIGPNNLDDKAWKSAYSDAFKRAAVKFEIGAYLYGGPSVWVPVKVGRNGKAQGFTADGLAQARAAYGRWIAEKRMVDLYGDPLDHGDVAQDSAGEPEPQHGSAAAVQGPAVSQADAAAAEPASPAEESFAQKAERAQKAGAKATKAQLAEIESLVDVCAAARGKTSDDIATALAADGYELADLTRSQAEELIGKLNRWAATLSEAAA